MKYLIPILILLALAALFYLWSRAKQGQGGLPEGRVVYADTDQWQAVPKPLYDAELNLVGKPDYMVALRNGAQVPVEVKSGRAPQRPYDSHLLQLAAYCWLTEKATGLRPPYGLLRYSDKSFEISYTPEMETQLLELVAEIRRVERCEIGPDRSHADASRCCGCGYREECDQYLSA